MRGIKSWGEVMIFIDRPLTAIVSWFVTKKMFPSCDINLRISVKKTQILNEKLIGNFR